MRDWSHRAPGRRGTLILAIALAVGSLLAGPPARAAEDACHPSLDDEGTNYVVVHDGLMHPDAMAEALPEAGPGRPAMAAGYQRGWHARRPVVGLGMTRLGLRPSSQAVFSGAIHEVPDAEALRAFDDRRPAFCREEVPFSRIRVLDGTQEPTDGRIWVYVTRPSRIFRPDGDYPIVQSEVDRFLAGCLHHAEKVERPNIPFAGNCVGETADWSTAWVNDRLHPRRPTATVPRARAIDQLLNELVPDAFAGMTVE